MKTWVTQTSPIPATQVAGAISVLLNKGWSYIDKIQVGTIAPSRVLNNKGAPSGAMPIYVLVFSIRQEEEPCPITFGPDGEEVPLPGASDN